jgi:hypothetical protein
MRALRPARTDWRFDSRAIARTSLDAWSVARLVANASVFALALSTAGCAASGNVGTTGSTGGAGGAAGMGGAGGMGGAAGTGGAGGTSCADGATEACYTGPDGTQGLGICVPGQRVCEGGLFGPCEGETLPTDEVCDALDNDCDGQVNEDCPCQPGEVQPCYSGPPGTEGVGFCQAGTQSCDDATGQWGACAGDVVPQAEACDGLDNDCNNAVDEGDPGGGTPCQTANPGECKNGEFHCIQGSLQCVATAPGNEVCDGKDNDCDGVNDNGNPGGGAQCATNLPGVCATGTETCAGVLGYTCTPDVAPGSQGEVCDGLDNDCDGQTDEGNPGGGAPCMTGLLGVCALGTQMCAGAAGFVCMPNAMPSLETCDGKDNDCNGSVDDAIAQVGQNCVEAGFVGQCQFGTYSCTSGVLTCDHPFPGTVQESCNGKDDDCDGTIDNPALLNGLPCTSAFPGVCAAGTTLCIQGSATCNAAVQPNTQSEVCDAVDNDCDGVVDDLNANAACAQQFSMAGGVASWSCGGTCEITACTSGQSNIDGAIGNGCECATDLYAQACGNSGTAAVPKGGVTTMSGKIESANGSDWLTFNFNASAVGQAYSPKVELTNSAGNQYAMDVMVNCAGQAQGCSTTGGANNENGINVNVWEQKYNQYIPGPGCCSDNTPRVTSVKVRVYRRFADAPTCTSYVVTATNP